MWFVPALPSLDLLSEEVRDELAAQERRFDALDSKAGAFRRLLGMIKKRCPGCGSDLKGKVDICDQCALDLGYPDGKRVDPE